MEKILVKLQEEIVTIWIFVFLAKQNISTDWKTKNSAEKPVQLKSRGPILHVTSSEKSLHLC